LPLKGEANEVGMYKCQCTGRGETRQRNFEVSDIFVDDKNDNYVIIISVTTTVIGFLLVGMGISIKFYLNKVKNQLKMQNANQFANIKIEFLKRKMNWRNC
jgi:hypothetical protein